MKRSFTIALILACVVGVVVDGRLFRFGSRKVVVSDEEVHKRDRTKRATHESDTPKLDTKILELPVRIAFLGNEQFSPCFVDLPSNTIYPWKGVFLHRDQLPNAGEGPRLKILNSEDFIVRPFEAPIKYRELGDLYRPGYLDHSNWVFYEWEGVNLTKDELLALSRDGKHSILRAHFANQVIEPIEIKMPAHLKDQPQLWKKT